MKQANVDFHLSLSLWMNKQNKGWFKTNIVIFWAVPPTQRATLLLNDPPTFTLGFGEANFQIFFRTVPVLLLLFSEVHNNTSWQLDNESQNEIRVTVMTVSFSA